MHGRLGRITLLPLAAALLLPAGANAVSFSDTAVLNGGTIQFAGTAANVNQFSANYGSAFIVGSDATLNRVDIHGAGWTTGGANPTAVFCSDVVGLAQDKNKVYYVYYAGYGLHNVANFSHVISTIAPFAEGYPSSPISFTAGGVAVANSSSAVFLGSYLTDGSKNMIPFARHGEEVILMPTCNVNVLGDCSVSSQSVTYTAGNTPGTLNVGPFTQLPSTASAMIANVSFGANPGDPGGDVAYITNPKVPSAAGCQVAPQLTPSLLTNYYNLDAFYWHSVRLRTDGAGNVPTAGCTVPVGMNNYVIYVSYIGYVEPMHHLY